jgi:outer membrane receptor protein involved in Fe transport
MVNLQINKYLGERWEIFAGAENLLNYRQPAPILNADQPWGASFDGGLTWGPIFGRNLYAGVNLRF